MNRQMHLIAFMLTGPTAHNHGMWRHPESENDFLNPEFWEQLGRTLEKGKFDGAFFADSVFFLNDIVLQKGGPTAFIDPLPISAIIARATKHLGLGVTLSTTYTHPYAIARSLGSLNVLSGGRIAWNIVTGAVDREAHNFGMERLPPRQERYDRAEEVLEVCNRLWDSFGQDALIMDKGSGNFADLTKFESFDFEGKWIKTKGPLIVPPSPQGRPVIMQAGASDRGRDFAARSAEIVFTVQHSLADMQAFYSDMKARTVKFGRAPEDCVILTAVDPILGETESIARERQAYGNELVDDELALATTTAYIGHDLSKYSLDEPFPDLGDNVNSRGTFEVMLQGARAENLTLRQMAKRFTTSGSCPQIVGTAESVADQLEDLFKNKGCDGFIIFPTVMPGTFESFTRSVVPILQKRGIFRKEYSGTTLRDLLRS